MAQRKGCEEMRVLKLRRAAPVTGLFALLAACASNEAADAPTLAAGPPAPAAPVYSSVQIMGEPAGSVDDLLGPPGLTRREGDGEFRRYALKSCSLIIILYPDEFGAARVAHIEASALRSGDDKPDVEACLAAG